MWLPFCQKQMNQKFETQVIQDICNSLQSIPQTRYFFRFCGRSSFSVKLEWNAISFSKKTDKARMVRSRIWFHSRVSVWTKNGLVKLFLTDPYLETRTTTTREEFQVKQFCSFQRSNFYFFLISVNSCNSFFCWCLLFRIVKCFSFC